MLYFTKMFPYLALIAFSIFGVTLDGASDGFYYYLYPDIAKLGSIDVWKDAAIEGFFSLSLTEGAMITHRRLYIWTRHFRLYLARVYICGPIVLKWVQNRIKSTNVF